MLSLNFAAERFRNPRPIQHFNKYGKVTFDERRPESMNILLRLIQLSRMAKDEVEIRTFVPIASHAAAVSPHFRVRYVLLQNVEQHSQMRRWEIKCRHGQIFREASFQRGARQ